MPHGSVACMIERQQPASTFGSGDYPWEIQVMSGQSEKVSLSFEFDMTLATGSISKAEAACLLFYSLAATRLSSERHPLCQGSSP